MKISDFYRFLEDIYGCVYSASILRDLYLRKFGCCGHEALNEGISPKLIFEEILSETEIDIDATWQKISFNDRSIL